MSVVRQNYSILTFRVSLLRNIQLKKIMCSFGFGLILSTLSTKKHKITPFYQIVAQTFLILAQKALILQNNLPIYGYT